MQRFTRRGLIIISSLALLLMVVTTLAVIPSLRNKVRGWVFSQDREILAKTSGYVTPDGPFISVFKIREKEGLHLEIFSTSEADNQPKLLQKIPLPDLRDGYVNFQGSATNLALSDTDMDGAMDLIAPTFDELMTPKLNVYRFNRALQVFEKFTPPTEE